MYVYGFSISGVFDDKSEGCVGEKVRVLAMGSGNTLSSVFGLAEYRIEDFPLVRVR